MNPSTDLAEMPTIPHMQVDRVAEYLGKDRACYTPMYQPFYI